MEVLERPVASFQRTSSRDPEGLSIRSSFALAVAFTSAAAVAGIIEVLFDRMAAPAAAGALGTSGAGVASLLGVVGRFSVGVTGVLVLLALLAWAASSWNRHRLLTLAATAAVVSTVFAGLFTHAPITLVAQASVVVAIAGVLTTRSTVSPAHAGAMWAIALAIVVGQWSQSGLSAGSTVVPRAVAEASLITAIALLGVAVHSSSPRGLAPVVGLIAGVGLGAVSLVSEFTPLVALSATGAMMWLPSLTYVIAAGAAGYVVAAWLSEPAARHRAAGLVLLAVAGIEPVLAHHSATALLGFVAVSFTAKDGALA